MSPNQQRRDHILHLCSGLFESEASGLNQQQARRVYLELLAQNTKQCRPTNSGELLQVSIDSGSLPDLFESGFRNNINNGAAGRRSKRFICQCARLSVDEQRELHLLALNQRNRDQSGQHFNPDDTRLRESELRNAGTGLLAGTRSSWRRKLIARFASKCRHPWRQENLPCAGRRDEIEMALYLLEPLIEAARRDLREHLQHQTTERRQEILLDSGREDECDENSHPKLVGQQLRMSAMIRAPVTFGGSPKPGQSRQDSGVDLAAGPAASSGDNSSDGSCYDDKDHSPDDTNDNRWGRLDELVSFQSSPRVQSIVGHSIGFFAKLISECPLLKLSADSLTLGDRRQQQATNSPGGQRNEVPPKMISLREFKLAACVGCQRLRASIRFDWLAHCLLQAFGYDTTTTVEHRKVCGQVSKKSGASKLPQLVGASISGWLEGDVANNDRLALLMGQLLRRHFLVPALELLCTRIELYSSVVSTGEPMLSLPIELQEELHQDGSPLRLSCNRADLQIRSALEFVVEEIGSVCANLPRLENQLESTRCRTSSPVHDNEPTSKIGNDGAKQIVVLHEGDDLLEQTKVRLGIAIEQFARSELRCMVTAGVKAPARDIEWMHEHYWLAIELINLLRSADQQLEEFLLQFGPFSGDLLMLEKGPKQESQFMRQLRVSSQQIVAIDVLKSRLILEAPRFVGLSLAKLDHEPLRASLITCLERERNLLVRLNSDTILKLMERLRMQLDEIELGCDLETAIEDYLSEKWQAKQSQQPNRGEQILLAGGDGDDDDNDNMDFAEVSAVSEDVDYGLDRKYDHRADEEPVKAEAGYLKEHASEEEQFVEEIMVTNHQVGMQANTGESKQLLGAQANVDQLAGLGIADRRVAPLIECQLLVSKYRYLEKLLHDDLSGFVSELDDAFEGLVFMSEFIGVSGGTDQLEPIHWELIDELSLRAQSFAAEMLSGSLKRLNLARDKLLDLNELRQRVLSQVVVEFHLLVVVLSRRKLIHQANNNDDDTYDAETDCIRLLDGIQKSSELANKLEMRCQFLEKQNSLLHKELSLLVEARFSAINEQKCSPPVDLVPPRMQQNFFNRQEIIDNWRLHVSILASFWKLAEEFETRLVKWLNSDTQKLEYRDIEREFFSDFSNRLDRLEELSNNNRTSLAISSKHATQILESNLNELRSKFRHFQDKRLAIFRFLTNKHLTRTHWLKLNKLLGIDVMVNNRQTYTTLAQFLELSIDDHVDELEDLDKQATMEHKLSMFLLEEAELLGGSPSSHNKLARALDVSAYLENWSDSELEVAASRFIACKLDQDPSMSPITTMVDHTDLACRLVGLHSRIKRFLGLVGYLNLDFCRQSRGSYRQPSLGKNKSIAKVATILSSNRPLKSPNSLRASFFVEFIRLFVHKWIESWQILVAEQKRLKEGIDLVEEHLGEIGGLVERVKDLEGNELRLVNEENDKLLIKIEQETLRLELEREILATREALAIERQQEALSKRDHCIKQITERAIPALRAATKALNCLDGRALRALRNLRPNPPEPVRQVIEAVCLLKSCVQQSIAGCPQQPLVGERRFDSLKGVVISDYWPAACRMLNGQHSSRFFADLKLVSSKRTIPTQVMRLIRARYLSSAKFKLNFIANVSPECAILAKWLIAVDVFDRVINVVRPSYTEYTEAEKSWNSLLVEVTNKRHQIDSIELELRQLGDLFRVKLSHKTNLSDLLDECKLKLHTIESTRLELVSRREVYLKNYNRLSRRGKKFASLCYLEAAESIYVDAVRSADSATGDTLRRILLAAESQGDHCR